MYCRGRQFDLLCLIAEMVHLTHIHVKNDVYMLVILVSLF